MALTDNEYHEILHHIRKTINQVGLGGIDERIISEMHDAQGPFYELIYYLKLLVDEIALGSDEQIKSVLRRIRESVETETGEPIQGIELQLTPEEADRYRTKNFVFGPDPALQEIVAELRTVIAELKTDHFNENSSDRGLDQ